MVQSPTFLYIKLQPFAPFFPVRYRSSGSPEGCSTRPKVLQEFDSFFLLICDKVTSFLGKVTNLVTNFDLPKGLSTKESYKVTKVTYKNIKKIYYYINNKVNKKYI